MSKKVISRLTVRLALVTAVILCALFACAGSVYASADSVLPEKNEKGVYEIYTASQLEIYTYAANGTQRTWEGETMPADRNASCVLMNDIDFEGKTWVQLGTSSGNAFAGTIDGQGHKLYNYQVSNKARPGIIIYNAGVVKDIILDVGTVVPSSSDYINPSLLGVVAQDNMQGGVFSGITVRGDLRYNTSSATGGGMICGQNQGIIRYCVTEGLFAVYSGGAPITRYNTNTGLIEYCYNRAKIVSFQFGSPYGLFCTGSNMMGTVRNCYNCGKLYTGGVDGTEVTDYSLTNATSGLEKMQNCYKADEEFTAADLGGEFVDDPEGDDSINNGYPVFPFQLGGDYPHVESAADLTVDDITYLDDTTMNLTSTTKFDYYKLKSTDFTIKIIAGDRVADVAVTDLSQGSKGNISLTFNSINEAKDAKGKLIRSIDEQDLTIKLLVAGSEVAQTDYHIGASRMWSDYAVEPARVTRADKRYGEKFSGYYKITKPEELAWVAVTCDTASNGVFRDNCFLTNDIYLNDTTDPDWKDDPEKMIWDKTIGWIENAYHQFNAVFDGNGFTIYGMYIDDGGRSAALFGDTSSNAVIQNLSVYDSVSNTNSTSSAAAAGIVARLTNGVVRNCSFSGVVTGGNWTGGIVGTGSGTITGCANYAKVKGITENNTGGIFGYYNTSTDIQSCYNTGAVTGGGIVGYASNTDIIDCYNAGKCTFAINATASQYIQNTYALQGCGKVTGNVDVLSKNAFTDGTLLEYLDSEDYVADEENINNGYPILKWQSKLIAAQAKYPEELQNYVDLNQYYLNGNKIQAIIDEAIERIANATTSAEAEAAFEEAKSAIDAIPNDVQAKQEIEDELARLQEQIVTATKTLAFDMCLISLDKTEAEYSGSAIEPVVTATTKDGAALVKDTDYEVAYDANVAPGVAKVLVTGKGSYAGTREITFNIAPAANKILKCKKAKKAFTVTWTKDELGTGYEVSYGLKKNFKGAKTVKIAKSETTSKKVSKLKAKKKYFVRVRTYVTSGEQTIYGAWSPVKSVKTK